MLPTTLAQTIAAIRPRQQVTLRQQAISADADRAALGKVALANRVAACVRFAMTTAVFQRLTFLLWLFAFLVCLSVLGFIAFGYLGHALEAFPKVG